MAGALVLVVIAGTILPPPAMMACVGAAGSDAPSSIRLPGFPDETRLAVDQTLSDSEEPLPATRLLPMTGFRPGSGEPVPRARRVHDSGLVHKASTCFSAGARRQFANDFRPAIGSRHAADAFRHCQLFTLQRSLRL